MVASDFPIAAVVAGMVAAAAAAEATSAVGVTAALRNAYGELHNTTKEAAAAAAVWSVGNIHTQTK